MRICYFANAASIHTQRWVNYFADHGWRIDLITWHLPKNSAINANVKIHRIYCPPFYLARYGALLEVALLLRKIHPDIIHAHYLGHFGILAGLYSQLSGFKPIVLSAWGSDVFVDAKGIQRGLINYALKRADVVTTTSYFLRDVIISDFDVNKSKIVTFPWGIDLNIFRMGYDSEVKSIRAELNVTKDNYVVLSPRVMTDYYRIEAIVQAVAYASVKHSNIVLLLLKGTSKDDSYIRKIIDCASEHGISKKVRIISRELNLTEMAAMYNLSDALVSIPKTDQFGSSIAEGMACGIIPIVANLEVYREYLIDGKNALFVNPEDTRQFGEKLVFCIEHPELKQKFYDINKIIIEDKLDWAKGALKMEELYIQLLSKKHLKEGEQ